MKNRGLWAKIIVTVATCILLLWLIDWNKFVNTLKAANGYWLFAVFVIIHMDRLFMAYKWAILLRTSGVLVSTGTIIKAYYIGSFWSSFLPSSIGGDAVRVGWLVKKVQVDAIVISSSIIVERFLGTLALAIGALGGLILLMLYLDLKLPALSIAILLFLSVSTIAVILLFSQSAHDIVHKLISYLPFQRVSRAIEKMRITILAFREKPRVLIAFLFLSILEQAFPIGSIYVMAKALSVDLSLIWVIIGLPIILAVVRIPISVNNLGIQEGIFAFIFSFAGVPLSASVLMSLTDRVLVLLAVLPGALWTVSASKSNVTVPVVMRDSDSMK